MIKELIALLNEALKMEHAAAVQYYTHAELVRGPIAEPIIRRLMDTADDERKHAEKLRSLLSDYLLTEPTMDFAPARKAADLADILKTNIETEREAVAIYRKIKDAVFEAKKELPDAYDVLMFDVNEILREEEEHIAELVRLL